MLTHHLDIFLFSFDKLEARLAHAMLSIPATKGFEIGSGFEGTKLRGSAHNDMFFSGENDLQTHTNNSGGTSWRFFSSI